MATTDAKPGFRLPWSSDRSDPSEPQDALPDATTQDSAPEAVPETDPGDVSTPVQEIETTEMIDAAPAATANEAAVDAPGAETTPAPESAELGSAAVAPTAPAAARKPNKFMADLTKAMQAAAESARADTLERLGAEAKTTIESIHTDSANEATELRKRADDDVAAVRDWSKAEIARIREETDERIAHRKARLEREIEEHATAIEARIERVQARVAAFEAEMGAFFEHLLAEDDPTRFAAMAENLPEPPPFDSEDDWQPTVVAVATPEPVAEAAPAEAVAVAEPIASEPETPAADDVAAVVETPTHDAAGPWTDETAPVAHPAHVAEASEATEAPASGTGDDLFSIAADEQAAEGDPRLSMLGLTPDFAAAEAEAAAFSADDSGPDETIPELADDAVAARIAGLVPDAAAAGSAPASTRVLVVGLVSVASIAGFKRHLSRATGVQSVGVSSGPDGEFVFTVEHDPAVPMRDVIPTLPGFAARVTDEADGQLTVAAQDPESEK